MKLSAPKMIVFLICVIVALVSLVSTFIAIPFISGISYWLMLGAFVLLALGCVLKGL